jgi:hypothetical protein
MTSLESLVQQLKSITGDSADSGPAAPVTPFAPLTLQPAQPVQPTQHVKSVPKGSRSLWMIGGLVFVVLLVGVGFWFNRRKQPPAAEPASRSPPPVQTQKHSAIKKQVRFEDEEMVDELDTFSPIPIEQT